MNAYVAARVLKGGNGGVDGATRHAVSDWVAWAMAGRPADAECGSVGALRVGEWDPEDPRNCSRCIRAIERQEELHRLPDGLVSLFS